MTYRLFASVGLALAAFVAATGVSSAALIETRSEVMYAAGALVVVILVLMSIGAAVKHAFGLDVMPPPDPNDDHGHGSHGGGHGDDHGEADDHTASSHAAPAAH